MGDETPVTSLVLPVLIRPVLTQVSVKLIRVIIIVPYSKKSLLTAALWLKIKIKIKTMTYLELVVGR